jgi:hypothetical protein
MRTGGNYKLAGHRWRQESEAESGFVLLYCAKCSQIIEFCYIFYSIDVIQALCVARYFFLQC